MATEKKIHSQSRVSTFHKFFKTVCISLRLRLYKTATMGSLFMDLNVKRCTGDGETSRLDNKKKVPVFPLYSGHLFM